MKLVYQYMVIFLYFSPTLNHLHPLQVENCDSNSRLVVTMVNSGSKGLSEYADDKQFIMDGSKSSLEAAMTIPNEFYYYSGFKINIEKNIGGVARKKSRIR